MKKILTTFILFNFLVSCVQDGNSRNGLRSSKNGNLAKNNLSPGSIGAVNSSSNFTDDEANMSQKVELSHLVDPFDGTYKKKLAIPKNFKGNLYLAGLNVASLTDKLISVRFNFGVEKQPITLKATVARAPGIVPKTDIQVLVIDMNNSPLKNMRLNYDLYDYNNYVSNPTKEIVNDPRDVGLYCRGLSLEDDPTFIPLNENSTCSGNTDKCLYSYAKVVDSTLYNDRTLNNVTQKMSSIPTRPQIWTENLNVRNPSLSNLVATACVPDDENIFGLNQFFNTNSIALTFDLLFQGYYYRGPYRAINQTEWQISDDAIFNSNFGLFQLRSGATTSGTGLRSLLFPRAGKISLNTNVNYLGSVDKIGVRAKMISDSSGLSQYVDGCNLRVLNRDAATNEHIGSCNVNSSVEVFYIKDGKEISIAVDKTIKLQLIKSSLNFQGKEVLSTAFKSCESSSSCGSEECCFNSRCWSKELVTQCADQTPVIGNQEIGANCSSDFECGSLCCNQSTGSCTPHDPNGSTPLFCNKNAGQQCVSKEFCKKEPVSTCRVVKNGFNIDGTQACTLLCTAVLTSGNCVSSSCVPPSVPEVPPFNPKNCSNAVDP